MSTANSQNTNSRAANAQAAFSTTPGRLQLMVAITGLGAILLWLIGYTSVTSAHYSVQTVGKDTVPSIIAAEQIRASLADMDANAANCFFSHGTREARAAYEEDRHKAADSLVSAANNITYGNEERVPILGMVDGLQTYVGLVETARSKGFPVGMDALRQSSDLMHNQLLPAAEALDKANFSHLDQIYKKSKDDVPASVTRFWFVGVLLLGLLVLIQVYLLKNMKRIINPPIAAASLILVVWLLFMAHALHAVGSDLKIAKEDAFDSVHALWKTRAVAYDANADESLYLLDRGSRRTPDAGQLYEQAFRSNVALIVNPAAPDQIQAQVNGGAVSLKGYLGDELSNITFDGEKQAALAAVQTYAAYLAIDDRIRQLEVAGNHQEAVDLCTGNNEGQSNWAFAQFDSALTKVLDINQNAFDHAISNGFGDLAGLNIFGPIVSVLILVLVYVGLLPRIREYSA